MLVYTYFIKIKIKLSKEFLITTVGRVPQRLMRDGKTTDFSVTGVQEMEKLFISTSQSQLWNWPNPHISLHIVHQKSASIKNKKK